MKRNRGLLALLSVFLLLAFAAGGLVLARPAILDEKREQSEAIIIAMIEDGQTEISGIPIPEVEGEDAEFFDEDEPGFAQPENGADAQADTGMEDAAPITGYGIITIPRIDLKMALMYGADRRALRGGAGWLPTSAEMGTAGNCVIFGHRMKRYGRHFNRLDELEKDDTITLKGADGRAFTYVVTGSEVVAPEELFDTLSAHTAGFCLTLVTCTPTGVGSHRLLVYAVLQQNVLGESGV